MKIALKGGMKGKKAADRPRIMLLVWMLDE